MLLLPTEATTEKKMNICTDRHHPTYHYGPSVILERLDLRIKTHHNQHRQRRGDRKISDGPLGHRHLLQSQGPFY